MFSEILRKLRLRTRRRRLLLRAIRKRRDLSVIADRSSQTQSDDIFCFATVRNEAQRLPYFLDHHRKMGVAHFFIVDNNSDDETRGYLARQKDVSLWMTSHSYRAARFGMDWLTWLQLRYGRGHWCLTLDADEALVLPHHDTRDLGDLTRWLDAENTPYFSALMLDLYPKGPLSAAIYESGAPFTDALGYYDAEGYVWERQPRYKNISIRGGPRRRVFFADNPDFAPHMHKTPLIKWHWRNVYSSSTHIALPTHLNEGFDARHDLPTGVLLHAKFLDESLQYSTAEAMRKEHFTHPENYDGYYASLAQDPVLWSSTSHRYQGWQKLVADGLMSKGRWH